jgi:hypothetical protein
VVWVWHIEANGQKNIAIKSEHFFPISILLRGKYAPVLLPRLIDFVTSGNPHVYRPVFQIPLLGPFRKPAKID